MLITLTALMVDALNFLSLPEIAGLAQRSQIFYDRFASICPSPYVINVKRYVKVSCGASTTKHASESVSL
jgi:hypothetical protein